MGRYRTARVVVVVVSVRAQAHGALGRRRWGEGAGHFCRPGPPRLGTGREVQQNLIPGPGQPTKVHHKMWRQRCDLSGFTFTGAQTLINK